MSVPVIWAFQPFNAFVLATASGPAWLLARRLGLERAWAAAAALFATVPALVYGYELIGSIKEITALPMVLTLGVLVVLHPRWLRRGPIGAIPFVSSPTEFSRFIADETDKWAKVIKFVGIKPE